VYDLGAIREVSSVSLVWFAPRGGRASVEIGLSTDGTSYETVDNGPLAGRGGNETLRSFLPHDARYVRVSLSGGSSHQALSLQEVGVHGGMTTGMR